MIAGFRIQLLAVLLPLLLGVAQSGFAQEMYQWTDEDGVVHFSDMPPQGVDATASPLPRDPAPATGVSNEATAGEPSAAQQRRDEIAEKSQQARAEQQAMQAQCSVWRNDLARLEPNRRVFYTNEAGETVRMDDVDRTDRVAELKSLIAQTCE